MRIAEVIGTVTLSRCHPTLVGLSWIIGVPFSLKGLQTDKADGEDQVICDGISASIGSWVGFSEGAEGAQPFVPAKKPVDAYAACILDQIAVSDQPSAISQKEGDR
jgi:ethanolamine utilization protein EutN